LLLPEWEIARFECVPRLSEQRAKILGSPKRLTPRPEFGCGVSPNQRLRMFPVDTILFRRL
jgi:hypothetical protein